MSQKTFSTYLIKPFTTQLPLHFSMDWSYSYNQNNTNRFNNLDYTDLDYDLSNLVDTGELIDGGDNLDTIGGDLVDSELIDGVEGAAERGFADNEAGLVSDNSAFAGGKRGFGNSGGISAESDLHRFSGTDLELEQRQFGDETLAAGIVAGGRHFNDETLARGAEDGLQRFSGDRIDEGFSGDGERPFDDSHGFSSEFSRDGDHTAHGFAGDRQFDEHRAYTNQNGDPGAYHDLQKVYNDRKYNEFSNPNFIANTFPKSDYPSIKTEIYPPSSIQENTPMMLPTKSILKNEKSFMSPILSSQNHSQIYHNKAVNSVSTSISGNSINSVNGNINSSFTPLVSPAQTPLEKYQPPSKANFEPLILTSPALLANNDKRRSSSSVYALDSDRNPSQKRRTPHGTPIMPYNQSSLSSVNAKNSPILRLNSSNKLSPENRLPNSFEELPESNYYGNTATDNKFNTTKDTDLQLMGFTMGKLQDTSSKPKRTRSTKKTKSISNSSSSSKSTSPNILAKKTSTENLDTTKKSDKPTKKATHKLAEQGRRDRMNQAVQELGNLIPKKFHNEVEIPSKATTVELASKYIRVLIDEINELKQR